MLVVIGGCTTGFSSNDPKKTNKQINLTFRNTICRSFLCSFHSLRWKQEFFCSVSIFYTDRVSTVILAMFCFGRQFFFFFTALHALLTSYPLTQNINSIECQKECNRGHGSDGQGMRYRVCKDRREGEGEEPSSLTRRKPTSDTDEVRR